MGFPREEQWSGLPCPTLGDLPHPGIELASLASPALALAPPGKPHRTYIESQSFSYLSTFFSNKNLEKSEKFQNENYVLLILIRINLY